MSFYTQINNYKPSSDYKGNILYIHHDQLNLAAFPNDLIADKPVLLFIESEYKGKSLPFHPKKLVYVLSSMRHAALNAAIAGFPIIYWSTKKEYSKALNDVISTYGQASFTFMEPNELGSRRSLIDVFNHRNRKVQILKNRFFYADVSRWIDKIKKGYKLEFFYRQMRKETGYLMKNGKPEGGQWNFDKENRKSLPKSYRTPKIPKSKVDEITLEVIQLVKKNFTNHIGEIEEFNLAVDRTEALKWLDDFIALRLTHFGMYEDAMAEGEDFINHSLLSTYLNNGLLLAREVCERIIAAYKQNETIPIQSVEGFIRQIIGWREYIRIYYEAFAEEIHEFNHFEHSEALPDSYWNANSGMKCVDESVRNVLQNGYAHHIQRLMVLSNFTTLVETDPKEVNAWFWYAFVDAYDWVTSPNVYGMSSYADGGILATKPYISSGSYINKMSDYCRSCQYDVKKRVGEGACPFNYLYWNFVNKHSEVFESNGRVSFMLKTYEKKSEEEKKAITEQATQFISQLQRYHQRFYKMV